MILKDFILTYAAAVLVFALIGFVIYLRSGDWREKLTNCLMVYLLSFPFVFTYYVDDYFRIGDQMRQAGASASAEVIYIPIMVVGFFIGLLIALVLWIVYGILIKLFS